jgi:hypothetical protein
VQRATICSGDGSPARNDRAIWLNNRERRIVKGRRVLQRVSLCLSRPALSRSKGSCDELPVIHVPLGYPQRGQIEPESPIPAGLERSPPPDIIAGISDNRTMSARFCLLASNFAKTDHELCNH